MRFDDPPSHQRCIAKLVGKEFVGERCRKRNGHGPGGEFCKIHARMIEKGPKNAETSVQKDS